MRSTTITLSISLLLSSIVDASTLDCDHIRVDNKRFNFEKIGGPHSVSVIDRSETRAIHNTTWTIDLCQPLKIVKSRPTKDQCDTGTRVCGIKEFSPIPADGDKESDEEPSKAFVEDVIEIAGQYTLGSGRTLDPKPSRLKKDDSEKEGLKLELFGGEHSDQKQKAVIEFQCDKERTGNEVDEPTDESETEDDGDGDDNDKNKNKASLTFVSYGNDGEMGILRLNWRTKYACEDYSSDDDSSDEDEGDGSKKSSWGVFTWFILIAFLGISAYLIFGSWLNYNRYGARGWDLLPHGDTIRDVPYIFKDFSRKVVDTFSAGGPRGGYSAV